MWIQPWVCQAAKLVLLSVPALLGRDGAKGAGHLEGVPEKRGSRYKH